MGAARGSLRVVLLIVFGGSPAGPGSAQASDAPAVAPAVTGSCGSGLTTSLQRDGMALHYRLNPDRPAVGVPFSVQACARSGRTLDGVSRPVRRIRFDAQMPQHGHGMNYQPSVSVQPDGGFRFEGSVLHMPGRWQLVFDVFDDLGRHRFTVDLDVGR